MFRVIENKEDIYCRICNKKYNRVSDLSRHIKFYHDISMNDYVLKYHLNNILPVCKCGCGAKVKMNGFCINETLQGHNYSKRYKIILDIKPNSNGLYELKCILCDKLFYYKTRKTYSKALHNKKRCLSCAAKNRIVSDESKRSKSKKLSKAHMGHKLYKGNTGKKFSKEWRNNMSIVTIKDQKSKGILNRFVSNYNRKAIKYIEKYDEMYNYNFRHAENHEMGGISCS